MSGRKNRRTTGKLILICFLLILAFALSTVSFSYTIANSAVNHELTTRSSTPRAIENIQMEKDWSAYLSGANAIAWGDMDNDGFLDLAIAAYDNPVSVFKNLNGTIINTAVWESENTYTATSLAWGYLDSDNYLDLAVGNGPKLVDVTNDTYKPNVVFINLGGILDTQEYWSSGDTRNTSDISWADVDNDGDLDLAAANYGVGGNNVVYKNNDGVLETNPGWVSNDASWTEAIAWGDLNNDGFNDLVAGNNQGDKNKIYMNQQGTLESTASWTSVNTMDTTDIDLGDIDNDGDLDLVTGTTSGDKACILYLNSGGTFSSNYDWALNKIADCNSIMLGDVNCDGKLDLGLGCTETANTYKNYIYLNNNGNLEQSSAWASTDNAKTTDLKFADVDNDGDLDLGITKYSITDTNKVYLNKKDILPPSLHNCPNDSPYGKIDTPSGVQNGTITFSFTLFDDESDPVWVEFQYSIDDQDWLNAQQAAGGQINTSNLATSKNGKKYDFKWNTSLVTEESGNVKVRILIHPKTVKICIYRYATTIATTGSFGYGNPPSAPRGFRVYDITTNSAILEWDYNPGYEDVIGYELYMNITDSTSEFKLLIDIMDKNFYTVTGLPENTSYYFKLRAYDSSYLPSKFTQRISCRILNNPPILNTSWETKQITINEDGFDDTSIDLNKVFIDPSGDWLRFGALKSNNFTINIGNDGFVYIQPNTNWYGSERITLTANDGQGQIPDKPQAFFELEVVVTPVNDKPFILKPLGTLEFNEDPEIAEKVYLLNHFNDPDLSDDLVFRPEGQSEINVKITGGYAEFMPLKNWNGIETIYIYANDTKLEIYDIITVIIQPVNDPPSIKVASTVTWKTGEWNNLTMIGSDVDTGDQLEFSTDILKLFPKLMPGDNFIFKNTTGELSVLVSKDMVGTYKLNVTVNDGHDSVTKNVGLTIEAGPDISGEKDGGEKTSDLMNTIGIVVIVIIIILIIVIIIRHRTLKISFKKCPDCGETMVQKGKGKFKCTGCHKIVDSTTKEPEAILTEEQQEQLILEQIPKAETTKVEGGIYPKSILDGSILEKDASEVEQSKESKGPVPIAVPLSTGAPQTPASAQATASTQVASPVSRPPPPMVPPGPPPPLPAPSGPPVPAPAPAPAQPPPAQPPAPAQPPGGEKFLCPNCNSQLSREMTKCPGCKAPLIFD